MVNNYVTFDDVLKNPCKKVSVEEGKKIAVELINKSNLIISIRVINKNSNQIVEKFDLEPQVKKVMQISEKWTVHFINDNDREGYKFKILNKKKLRITKLEKNNVWNYWN